MTVTSKSTVLVLGTIDPATLARLDALASQQGITIVTESEPRPVEDPLAAIIENLRIEPRMACPRSENSTPYYRRFERRRHWR